MNKNSKQVALAHRKEQKQLGVEGCKKQFASKRNRKWLPSTMWTWRKEGAALIAILIMAFSPMLMAEEIYEAPYGMPEILPSAVIERTSDNEAEIYNAPYGQKEILPSAYIERDGNDIKVYDAPYGQKELLPSYIIKGDE